MKHLGDITKIDWFHVPPVDVVTGGSPCQDLSVAGKRAGLAGERSGLYMEQIRCVKELRQADEQRGRTGFAIRPRYMVWENVPGAFSSNGGEDFRAVLEEAAKIAQPNAVIPQPPKGKWTNSGAIVGDGWSIAWRVHDAQFWGVPQRRRRISVVCDFGGLSAPEILFERKGLSGDFEPGGTPGEETAGGTRAGTEGASRCLTGWDCQSKRIFDPAGKCGTLNSGTNEGINIVPSVLQETISFQERAGKPGGGKGILIQNERTGALSTLNNQSVFCAGFSYGQSAKASSVGCQEERSPTLRGGEGGNQKPCVMAFAQNQVGEVRVSFMSGTLNTNSNASGRNSPLVYDARGNGDGLSHRGDGYAESDVMYTLNSTEHHAVCVEPTMIEMTSTKNTIVEDGISPTLTARMGTGGNQVNAVCVGNGQLNQVSMLEQANTMDTMHDQQAVMVLNDQGGSVMDVSHDSTATLRAQSHGHEPAVMISAVDCRNLNEHQEVSGTLQSKENGGYSLNYQNPIKVQGAYNGQRQSVYGHSIVRRLTPLEAERLQGYPDGWTDIGEWTDSKGKKHKPADSPRYKALGNSIALPFWFWLLRRISAQYIGPATLGSLFDGIGGFPLCWERCNGNGTALWASEIEEFPMAVTRRHF